MSIPYSPEEVAIRRDERDRIVRAIRETAKKVPTLAALVHLAIANEIVREGEMLYGTGEPDNRPTISVSSCPHKTSEECDCMSRENLGLTQ